GGGPAAHPPLRAATATRVLAIVGRSTPGAAQSRNPPTPSCDHAPARDVASYDPCVQAPRTCASEAEAARAAVAVGEQAGEGRDGDLGRCARTDVEPDRSVDPGDLLARHAELGERLDVGADVARVAQHADPPGGMGEQVAQDGAELGAVMV